MYLLEHSSDALLSQINAVLDYSQLSHQSIVIDNSEFCIHQLINSCLQVCSAKAMQQSINLSLNTDKPHQSWICADQHKIRQILLNLIANAVKFTQQGVVNVDYKFNYQHGCVQLLVKVKDTGIGIEARHLNSIFEPFTQADNSIQRKFGGSGLGLAISKQLAVGMHGELSVQSQYQLGSEFSLTLPVIKLDKAPAEKPKNIEVSMPTADCHHILLVEDNVINQKVATRMLEKLGAKVSVVSDGQLALDFQLFDIDLIFMDIQMPVLDGLSATRQLRARGETLPIVALTANASDADKKRCFASGMDDCISKPYTIQSIQKIMTQFLHQDITQKTA